ncbi:MAG: leucyl aminopeptidase [Eubacteriales bacterium]|nr:leucyl aminopeptidase [Eubacteriales bacterium]
MQVILKNHSELKQTPQALMRKAGDQWPDQLAKFQAEFDQDKDEAGVRTVRIAGDGKVLSLVVNTVKADADLRTIQKSIKNFYQEVKQLCLTEVSCYLTASFDENEQKQVAKFWSLADNCFDWHIKSGYKNSYEDKSQEDKEKALKEVTLFIALSDTAALESEIKVMAEAIAHTRMLVNEPANIMTPVRLSEEAKKQGEKYGFEVEVLEPEKIQELGMDAYWSVAKGSDAEPRFIIMRYQNNPDSDKKLGLVGKGLCYDSGGYDIKPGSGMRTMNSDMAGSAAVIGAMSILAGTKAKVNVVALVAACENMISGHAFHCGDIIGSMSGKSIEIMSTDAEGRLTLADAVTYAWKKEGVDAIADIATLTGAVVVALGGHVTGSICDNEELAECIQESSAKCGDLVHRLPMDEEYEAKNKSERADIKNGGFRGGGSITAGLFVRAFANNLPFLHLDIAGTAYDESGSDLAPKGASGVGAELLAGFAESYFARN